MAAKKVRRWKVLNKCYANGELYLEGDIVDGGNFSKNDNFEDMGEVEEEEAANGSDIPHTETGNEGSN